MHAPLLLFVYNRPGHTRRCLRSLAANASAHNHPLYVFSDGPRSPAEVPLVEKVRQTIRREAPCRDLVLIERPINRGLAPSVIAGMTEVMARHERAIVLEDDLELSPFFLDFMQAALERYGDEPRVMQISGYMFPLGLSETIPCPLLPLISSWGWATWARAWRHFDPALGGFRQLQTDSQLRRRFDLQDSYPFFHLLERQARGQADSWAIRWYLSVFRQNGLTLFPPVSLVQNRGWDGSGTHCTSGRQFDTPLATQPSWNFPEGAEPDRETLLRLQTYFRKVVPTLAPRPGLFRRLLQRLARLLKDPRALSPQRQRGREEVSLPTQTNAERSLP